jgi:hypothetical protein
MSSRSPTIVSPGSLSTRSSVMRTKDTQDRAFLPDGEDFMPASRVIAAWGDSATPTYHGPNFAMGSVRFFGSTNTDSLIESFRSAMDVDADGSFFVGASNYSVPVVETTYMHFCFTYDDLISQGIIKSKTEKKHIIGIESMIDPRGYQARSPLSRLQVPVTRTRKQQLPRS